MFGLFRRHWLGASVPRCGDKSGLGPGAKDVVEQRMAEGEFSRIAQRVETEAVRRHRRSRCRYLDRRTRTSHRAPGVPNALSEEPKRNCGKGFKKPRENAVSTCITLSRNPLVGGIAGYGRASRMAAVKPISEPPVARSRRLWPPTVRYRCRWRPASRLTRTSSRLKSSGRRCPWGSRGARAVRLSGLSNAATKRAGIVLRCSSSSAWDQRVQVRHAVAIHRSRQADVEVQSEGAGYLLGEKPAKRTPQRGRHGG